MVWDQDAINYIQSQVGNITYEHSFLLNRNQGSIHGPETWALWKTGWLYGQPEYISAESNLPNWYIDTSVLQEGAGEVAEYTIGTANAKALEAGVTYWSQLVLEPGDDPDCTTANHIVCESAQLIADLGYHFANCNIIKPPFCIDDSAHTHLNELGSSGTYWTIDIPSIYHWPRQVVENTPTSIAQPPTPVVSTPTRQNTTPTPVATPGGQVSCSNIGAQRTDIAYTFSEKNCLGEYSWTSAHNDPNGPSRSRQKSIFVPFGKVLWIYEHNNREGKSECLSGSVADLSAIGWENMIESAYLESGPCFQPTATSQPAPVREVKFYNETNFEGGRAFTLGEGNHYPRDLGHGERFHKFESMRICDGCVVNVYDSVGAQRCWVYDEDKVGNHGLYGQDAVRIQISTNQNPICTPWLPKYTSPQENTVFAAGQDIVIGWKAGDEFANRFTVEVWRNGVLGYNQVKNSNSSATISNAQTGEYLVRLQSHWGSNYSVWHDRYFTVIDNPSKPEIRLPYPDQVFRPGDEVDVHWGRTDSTTTEYKTQLWCNWELLEDTGRVTYGSKWFGPLPEGDCMAQVESFNPVGSSGWSQRLFKVRPEPPASPDIYHPTEGQAFHSRYTVLIGWNSVPTATQYNVELWGPNGLVESWIGTRELVLVAGQLPQGSYRVRIHSLDKWGQFQEWKDTTFFTVDPTPTPTNTPTATATRTATAVPTSTATATKIVPTSTNTPSPSKTLTATATNTVVVSRTPMPTNTPRPTSTSVAVTATPTPGVVKESERIFLPLVLR